MRRAVLLTPIVALALWPFGVAASPASTVDVVKVDGSIDRTVAGYLTDLLDQAQRDGSTVVIQLDTAGTLDEDAVGLSRRIFESKVPVIVWVGPAPAKAAGAGLLFMYASSLAAVSPGSQTGPLLPLDLAHPSAEFPDLRQMVEGWIQARGKGTELPVRDRPLTAAEAMNLHIAQVASVSIPDLLDKLDGLTVPTAAGDVTLATRIAERPGQPPVLVRFHELGPVDRVLHSVASPTAIYLLLVVGLAAVAFELTQSGFGFAGASGIAMLALAVYGLAVVPFSWVGLALIVGGVAFLHLDVVVRRLGILTALGLVLFLSGLVVAFQGVAPAIRVSPWLIGLAVVASFLYYGFVLTVAVRSRERITSTQRGLVGLVGETRGKLEPEGPVFVKGALWRGRSADGPIPSGTRVRVRGVDGLILRVDPEPPEEE